MKTPKVVVVPYDQAWKTDFEAIRQEIQAALGEWMVGIEHVGSTSVEGLAAKPILDIDVVIRSYDDFAAVVQRLAAIGYIHEGDLGIKDREAFRYDNKTHLQKHHLYVCTQDSAELNRHITFRNYLRSHPQAAAEYGAVKTEAAALYPNDIDAYIAHKAPCIAEIYKACGLL